MATRGDNSGGPLIHRMMVRFFSALLAVLIYWLLGFVVGDIEGLAGPTYAAVEAERVDAALVTRERELAVEIQSIERDIGERRARQEILRDGAQNGQRTMDQLLELQRMSLERNVPWRDADREALAESQRQFLENQRAYQDLSVEVRNLDQRLTERREGHRQATASLSAAREPARAEYEQLRRDHRFRVAALQLSFLVPLLLASIYLFLRFRSGSYSALVYPLGVASLAKVLVVMHEYFPSRYFKYVLIALSLLVVVRVLVHLLRMVARPGREWLLRQYRDAYDAFFCPVCDFPIRRGPLKFMRWTRRSLKKRPVPIALEKEEPYTCPTCSTELYETCESCGDVRHSLLPSCQHCGSLKEEEPAAAA